jgi:hypothetical protein
MKKMWALFFVVFFSVGMGQQVIGNWVIVEDKDAFTDQVSYTIIITESGEVEPTPPMFSFVCRNGVIDTIAVTMRNYLDSGEVRNFDYRVDDGEVKTVRGFYSSRIVAVVSSMSHFPTVRSEVMSATKLAIRATSYNRDTYTVVFDLTGLGEALAATNCRRG